jgi:hypothetical protein
VFAQSVLWVALLSPAAHAADKETQTLAVQLFDEAPALIEKGQNSQACPKLAESYRLDPQLGALLNLAECYEKNGQLASAWSSYRNAEELARKIGDEREGQAVERVLALEPRLSHVVFQLPGGERPPGYQLTRDGVVIAKPLWGSALAVDPGRHRIVAEAPGYDPWSTEVEVAGEANTITVVVKPLTAAAGAEAPPSTPPSEAPPPSAAEPTHDSGVATTDSRRIAALATGGLGLVAIGVGGFFGLSAQNTFSDSEPLCNERNICTGRGSKLRQDAKDKATIATVATGVGVAAIVGAAVLWFTAPSPGETAQSSTRSPCVAVGLHRRHLGLELSGSF